jgi:hypothetical protein
VFGGYLHLVPVVAVVAIVGALTLRGSRRELGLGSDLALWLVMACNLVVVAGTYVFGTTAIRVWLGVSVDRVVLFAVVMALVDVAVWSLVAVDLLLSEGTPPALDGGRPGVLHQRP